MHVEHQVRAAAYRTGLRGMVGSAVHPGRVVLLVGSMPSPRQRAHLVPLARRAHEVGVDLEIGLLQDARHSAVIAGDLVGQSEADWADAGREEPSALAARKVAVVRVFRGRAQKARLDGRTAAAAAFEAAADRIERYRASDSLDLIGYAFDQAVITQSLPDVESVADWLDDQIGNERLGKPYKTAPWMDGDKGERPSLTWYARHYAYVMVSPGVPDHSVSPEVSQAIMALAAVTVVQWKDATIPGNKTRIQELHSWLVSSLPREAVWLREFISTGRKITDFQRKKALELLKEAVETIEEGTRPPGGWGVGLTLALLTGTAVAVYRFTPNLPKR